MATTTSSPALTLDEEVGALVQSEMFRRRLNQGHVAEALGIGQSTVSAKLRGKVGFSISDLFKVAALFGVEPAALLPRLDSNQRPFGCWSPQVSGVPHLVLAA